MKKINSGHITVNNLANMHRFHESEIFILQGDGQYTDIFLLDGRKISVCKSLAVCLTIIDCDYIERVCKEYAVNTRLMIGYDKEKRQLNFKGGKSIIIPIDSVPEFKTGFFKDTNRL